MFLLLLLIVVVVVDLDGDEASGSQSCLLISRNSILVGSTVVEAHVMLSKPESECYLLSRVMTFAAVHIQQSCYSCTSSKLLTV